MFVRRRVFPVFRLSSIKYAGGLPAPSRLLIPAHSSKRHALMTLCEHERSRTTQEGNERGSPPRWTQGLGRQVPAYFCAWEISSRMTFSLSPKSAECPARAGVTVLEGELYLERHSEMGEGRCWDW